MLSIHKENHQYNSTNKKSKQSKVQQPEQQELPKNPIMKVDESELARIVCP